MRNISVNSVKLLPWYKCTWANNNDPNKAEVINPSLVNLYRIPIRNALKISSSKKGDEMLLMNRD